MRCSLPIMSLALLAACNPHTFDDFVAPLRADAASPAIETAERADAGENVARDAAQDGAEPDSAARSDSCGQTRPTPAQFGIEDGGVVFAGVIPQSAHVSPRWPTSMIELGGDYWWLFGTAFRSGTLAVQTTDSITLSTRQMPYTLRETAADAPVPTPFLPALDVDRVLLANEQLTHGPGTLFATGPNDWLLFYAPAALSGSPQGLTSRHLGTRVAQVHIEGKLAQATPVAPLVFGPELPAFRYGVLHEGHVYLYGCQPNSNSFSFDCVVARAPLQQASVGTSYQFRTATDWSRDFSAATPVLTGARDELSVTFNPFLQRFLAVHMRGLEPVLELRTADSPEGPWESFATIELPPPEGRQITHFGGMEQPALATSCGRKLVLTFLFKTDGEGSELRRVEVLLREGPH